MGDRVTLPHHCPRCPGRWSGANTCHCSVCHITFSGYTAFDKHRAGSHAKGRYCLDPEAELDEEGEKVFRLTSRAYPCWGLAGEKPEFWSD